MVRRTISTALAGVNDMNGSGDPGARPSLKRDRTSGPGEL